MAESLGNKFMKLMINSPLGRAMGESMAVITLTGRKTGKQISTPINVVKAEDAYYAISSRDRTWWRNLRGGAVATLRVAGKTYQVNGQVFETNDDVKNGLNLFFKLMPAMANYLKININADGSLNEHDLNKIVLEKVFVKLELSTL